MSGLAFGDYLAVRRANDFVAKTEGTATEFGDVSANQKLVVVIRGSLVAAIAFGYHQERVILLFHITV